MARKKGYDKQFKIDAVKYGMAHPHMTHVEVAKHLDIPISNYNRWRKEFNDAPTPKDTFRGSGNYASEDAKEAARLRKENKDLKDALEILKKAIGILGD